MDLWQPVDIYCERIGPQFWAEPVNAISNLAFVVAALWAAVEARHRGITAPVIWLLIGMAALIGVGSFLFHSFATVWSGFADTIPIWSFVAVFVLVAMHRIGGVRPGRISVIAIGVAAVLVVVFLASGDGSAPDAAAAPQTASALNGSEQYAPALLALLVFSGLMARRQHPLCASGSGRPPPYSSPHWRFARLTLRSATDFLSAPILSGIC